MIQGRAIMSLTNKSGMVPFAAGLIERGVKIYSTGGTAKGLQDAGLSVIEISEYTGFPEGMDGRLKTLHPKVHGGILGRQDKPSHTDFQRDQHIFTFQIVVVNLYDFEGAAKKANTTFDEVVEEVDIGGPAMIRAAAKNYRFCLPVVDPSDYTRVLNAIDNCKPDSLQFPMELRRELQCKAFELTAAYDAAIVRWLITQELARADIG